ncbi:hypothetical protein OG21DRAFT_1508517 [Imleria badia]|nr:hypothetical protein OG21DRAFT_1508517 [Imleria badia]
MVLSTLRLRRPPKHPNIFLAKTSCSAGTSCSTKFVIRDTIIALGAIFIGTSLSQGRSRNSGPARYDVSLPPPAESA